MWAATTESVYSDRTEMSNDLRQPATRAQKRQREWSTLSEDETWVQGAPKSVHRKGGNILDNDFGAPGMSFSFNNIIEGST